MASRPSLPASSSDFALPPSSSAFASSAHLADEFNPLILRFRRPSLLAPPRASFYSEGRLNSPLVSSFTIPLARRHTSSTISGEESESDRDKMSTDSPSPSVDSGSNTPLTPSLPPNSAFADKDKSTSSVDSDTSMKSASGESSGLDTADSLATARPRTPSTPPPRPSTSHEREYARETSQDGPRKSRRPSHPVKMPRIRTLVAESHTEENEVKSEAQFQRLVSSFSEHPTMPRTPRALTDRGRYPEDATLEEPSRDENSSDEEDEAEEPAFSYTQPQSEPINISKSVTPAQSVNGDDFTLSESPSNMPMDIDMPSSASGSPKLTAWRYTPPPTSSTSAIRSNKRKLDDRYDPYPTSNKRRAVSPSVTYLRDSHSYYSPRTPNGSGRIILPLPHPIAIPVAPSSGASSPIVPSSLGNGSRPVSWGPQGVLSSPTLRAQIGLASPVLRPMMRRREEKEVDGTGEAVGGLTLE